jgi:hypothetical protein
MRMSSPPRPISSSASLPPGLPLPLKAQTGAPPLKLSWYQPSTVSSPPVPVSLKAGVTNG